MMPIIHKFKNIQMRKFWEIQTFAMIVFVMMLTSSACGQDDNYGRKYVVSQNHYLSSDTNPGTADWPFKTIGRAAALAGPGDTVLVHTGIYREWVAPARGGLEGKPVQYLAAPNEEVIVRGSEVYTGNWKKVEGYDNIFSTEFPDSFFTAGFNPFEIVFRESRGGGRQGQIFFDGVELFEARERKGNIADGKDVIVEKTRMQAMYDEPGTWSTLDGKTIFVHMPEWVDSPQTSLIELSVQRQLFAPVRRAQHYINLKGFIFEHCANDVSLPQVGAVSTRGGQHWIIENNVIRHIKTIGLDFGAQAEDPMSIPDVLPEDRYRIGGQHGVFTLADRPIAGRHLIINNVVSDCGQGGMAGLFSDGSILMGNVVERCGKVIPGFESGGIKIHGLMGGTVEANLVRDNEAWGIWLDCGYIGSRVTRNVVVNNKASGIFFENSNGPGWIDNNIIVYNRGDGIYAHDASGVHIANNLIFGNKNFGIYMCVATDRMVPPYHYATGLLQNEMANSSWSRIANNIITGNKEGPLGLPYPSERAQDNHSDFNIFGYSHEEQIRFVQHFRNGSKSPETTETDQARAAFQQSGDGGLSAIDLIMWKDGRGYSFDLNQWRNATGYDLNSKKAMVSAEFDTANFELKLILDETAQNLNCPPMQTLNVRDYIHFSRIIDKDFFSVELPEDYLLSGAIQSVTTGFNTWIVWPIEFEYPAMPPKVAIQPATDR
jgi:parallel beta-helix repeat protein